MRPRVKSFALPFLVDDLGRSMAYCRKLGIAFGEPWGASMSSESWTGWIST